MSSRPAFAIRDVRPSDEEQWKVLYAGYRNFYRLGEDASKVDTTWKWVRDKAHGIQGLVAVEEGTDKLAGLANLRVFARPASATLGLFLDDLFVSPNIRKGGAGVGLLKRAAEIARDENASLVRWITAKDNVVARALYDKVAAETHWVTYDMQPASAK